MAMLCTVHQTGLVSGSHYTIAGRGATIAAIVEGGGGQEAGSKARAMGDGIAAAEQVFFQSPGLEVVEAPLGLDVGGVRRVARRRSGPEGLASCSRMIHHPAGWAEGGLVMDASGRGEGVRRRLKPPATRRKPRWGWR